MTEIGTSGERAARHSHFWIVVVRTAGTAQFIRNDQANDSRNEEIQCMPTILVSALENGHAELDLVPQGGVEEAPEFWTVEPELLGEFHHWQVRL